MVRLLVPALVRVAVVRSRLGFFVPFVVVLVLAGCGDDPEADDQPTGDPTVQTSEPTAAPSDPTPSEDPTETVQPATGAPLELSNVALRAPKGFAADPPDGSNLRFAFERDGVQSISLANTQSFNEALSLREQARISITSGVYQRQPSIMKPVEFDGVRMYHYGGRISDIEYVEEYGTVYDGSQISVNFRLAATASKAERQQLVESVMASLKFL